MKDAAGLGIAGVTISGGGRGTTTDAGGGYTLEGLPAGTHTLTPSRSGYTFSPASKSVTVPPNALGINFTGTAGIIKEIEINQGLGGEYEGLHGLGYFVAGKETVVRVFLSAPVVVDATQQRLFVLRDGVPLADDHLPRLAETDGKPTWLLTFICPSLDYCEGWKAGEYEFVVMFPGISTRIKAVFGPTRELRILAVPVKVMDRGSVKVVPDDQWKHAGEFLTKVYPIAADGLQWELGPELDMTYTDLTTEAGRLFLWKRLEARQIPGCTGANLAGLVSCYDFIVGFIPPMSICTETGSDVFCIHGWTYPGGSATIVMTNGKYDIDGTDRSVRLTEMQATVAHEVGHVFGLGDEYDNACGAFQCDINPPPASFGGREWVTTCDGNTYHCTDQDVIAWPGPGSGSRLVSSRYHPYEVGGRGDLLDQLCFMGGTGATQERYWVTPAVYDHLFERLAPRPQLRVSGMRVTQMRGINLSGWINKDDTVTLEPWYQVTLFSTPPASSGGYLVEALDSIGLVLASQAFDVSYLALSNPPQDLEMAQFDVVMPFPPETTAFRITRSGVVLRIVPVSANAPTVTVTAPTAGEILSGRVTITWQPDDSDADQLYHTIVYGDDEQDWVTLAGPITGTSYTADFSELAGSENGRIRVFASDGVNSAWGESTGLRVHFKAPEVFIEYPMPENRFEPGQSISLRGSSYDLQDGWLRTGATLLGAPVGMAYLATAQRLLWRRFRLVRIS